MEIGTKEAKSEVTGGISSHHVPSTAALLGLRSLRAEGVGTDEAEALTCKHSADCCESLEPTSENLLLSLSVIFEEH